jgi:hypothetical protein
MKEPETDRVSEALGTVPVDVDKVTTVQPVQNVNGSYTYEYNYTGVHAGELDLPVILNGRLYARGELGVWSFYKSKPPILIRNQNLYRIESSSREKAQEQAYYTASILASEGYVSNWKKQ